MFISEFKNIAYNYFLHINVCYLCSYLSFLNTLFNFAFPIFSLQIQITKTIKMLGKVKLLGFYSQDKAMIYIFTL